MQDIILKKKNIDIEASNNKKKLDKIFHLQKNITCDFPVPFYMKQMFYYKRHVKSCLYIFTYIQSTNYSP